MFEYLNTKIWHSHNKIPRIYNINTVSVIRHVLLTGYADLQHNYCVLQQGYN